MLCSSVEVCRCCRGTCFLHPKYWSQPWSWSLCDPLNTGNFAPECAVSYPQ